MRIRLKNSTGNHLQQRHDFHPSLYVFTESHHICLSRFFQEKFESSVRTKTKHPFRIYVLLFARE